MNLTFKYTRTTWLPYAHPFDFPSTIFDQDTGSVDLTLIVMRCPS